MDSKSLKSLSISVLLTVAVLWVFARPLGAFGLFIYRYTGAYVFEIGKNLEATQANAQSVRRDITARGAKPFLAKPRVRTARS